MNSVKSFFWLFIVTMLSLSVYASANGSALRTAQADSSDIRLKGATVKGTKLMFVNKKDTVIYNLDALGATKGDMLADMIKRMPGLELRDGVLYYNGRVVNRILVNGTDFSRGDSKTALEVLPAYIIKSIKAYQGKTDISKITGIDDNIDEQVIDVILKKEYHGTWIGNADIAGGTDDRWLLRGFANNFTDNMRATVYGSGTNTSTYQSVGNSGDWSNNGISSGDTRYVRPGFSLMFKNKHKRGEEGFFQFDAAGSYDLRDHNDLGNQFSEEILSDGTSRYTATRNHTINKEAIWNLKPYLTWQPTKTTYLEFNPGFTYRNYTERANAQHGIWSKDVLSRYLSPLDILLSQQPSEAIADGATTLMQQHRRQDDNSYTYNHYLYATQQLTKSNLRLSLRHTTRYGYSSDKENSMTSYTYYQPTAGAADPLYNRYIPTSSHNYNFWTAVDLNIPLKFFETLRLTYCNTTANSEADNHAYRLERLGGIYADYADYLATFGTLPTEADWRTIARDADMTLYSDERNNANMVEAYLQYKHKNSFFASVQANVNFHHDKLNYHKGDHDPINLNRNARSYVLGTEFSYGADSVGRYKLKYNWHINPISIGDLIVLPNTDDPLNIEIGNPNLKGRKSHSIDFNYDRTFNRKSHLTAMIIWKLSQNDIQSAALYDKETGVTTHLRKNINGRWGLTSALIYRTPLDEKRRLNLVVQGQHTINNSPTFRTSTTTEPLRASIRRNTVELVSQLSYNGEKLHTSAYLGYGLRVENAYDAVANRTKQQICGGGFDLQYTLPFDIVAKSALNARYNVGTTADSQEKWNKMWTASIQKSLLKDKSLALKLECYDILNQGVQTWYNPTSTSTTWGNTNSIGRTFMLHAIYNFSTKKQK